LAHTVVPLFAFSDDVDISQNKWLTLGYGDVFKCIKILKYYKTFDFRTITVEFY